MDCSICSEPLGKAPEDEGSSAAARSRSPNQDSKIVVATPCGHIYHKKCIAKWLAQQNSKRRCAMCNKSCSLDTLIPLYLDWTAPEEPPPKTPASAEQVRLLRHQLSGTQRDLGMLRDTVKLLKKDAIKREASTEKYKSMAEKERQAESVAVARLEDAQARLREKTEEAARMAKTCSNHIEETNRLKQQVSAAIEDAKQWKAKFVQEQKEKEQLSVIARQTESKLRTLRREQRGRRESNRPKSDFNIVLDSSKPAFKTPPLPADYAVSGMDIDFQEISIGSCPTQDDDGDSPTLPGARPSGSLARAVKRRILFPRRQTPASSTFDSVYDGMGGRRTLFTK